MGTYVIKKVGTILLNIDFFQERVNMCRVEIALLYIRR